MSEQNKAANTNEIIWELDESFGDMEPIALQALNMLDRDVMIVDKQYRIQWMNEFKRERFPHVKPMDMCWEVFESYGRRCPHCCVHIAIANGKRHVASNLTSVDSWGQVHHTDIIAEPIWNAEGEIIGAIEIAASVEEQYQTTEKLERLNNEYESVIYALSHDLRSPLVSVEGFVRKLEKKYLNNGQDGAKHCIQRIRANVRMMNDFVKVLLDTSRIATGEFEIQPVDMQEVVDEVINSMQERVEKQGVVIVTDGEFPIVECDRVRAIQVFSNLVGNCLSHCKETENLKITINGQQGVFSVSDNGPGMDEEFRDRAFEPFSQGTRNTDNHFGMGMNIVFKIVEKHGGEIWIESQPDQGTTVSFTFAPPPYRGVQA